MKKQFLSKAVPRGTRTIWRYLGALFILFTFAVGNVWADEIFTYTLTGAGTDGKIYTATGGSAKCVKAMASGGSNEITIGSQTFYKFNSSSQWDFTLSTGTFNVGDVLSFTCACGTKNKSGKGVKINNSISVTGDFPASTANTITYTVVADDGIAGKKMFSLYRNDSDIKFGTVSVTRSSGGGDPVDPEFTYTPATYVIGDPALDLSTKLSSTNTTGAITFAIKDAAGTGASIANSKNFTATTAGTAKVTVSQEASTGYNAKSQDIDVTVAAPDPCTTHFYFYNEADQTSNGKTNSAIFTNTSTGSSNMNGSITIDGTTYYTTRRSGDPSSFANFDIPANKAGTFYTLAVSSGSNARKIVITNTATSATYEYDVPGGSSAYTTVTIPNLPTGSYSVGKSGGNTRLGMMALKVCDAEYHTITLDLDGGTGATSIQVLDGVPATKPADPTKAHCAFAGWVVKSTSAAYDWAANVTGDLTLKATWTQLYTVTFADGGGSGDAPAAVADKAQGETFAVPANTFTAPEGKEFDKWNDGFADYAPGDTYTVGTDNVVLTAVWKQLVAKYTVVFKDGETELGTKLFDVASNPSDADINKTKPLFTFAAWQKEGVDIALDDAFWATVEKDAEVTLTARWTKAYATSYDMEAYAVSDGATLETLLSNLDAAGYAYTKVNGIDYGHTHNYIYDGMKYKTNNGDLSFNVNAGKLVIVKTGNLPANALTMYINDVADPTVFVGANEAVETHVNNYFYSEAEALYRLDIQASKGTCAIKAVTITDPFQVTFNANGGDPVASQYGHPAVTLPDASNGTKSLLGWFDAAEGGNKIGDVGESYTPAADIELFAQWEDVSTDARLASITFSSDAGTLSPEFNPEVTDYTYTMPYGSAIPTITGGTAYHAQGSVGYIVQAENWGDVAEIRGIAASADTKKYQITMLQEPKDGVCLVKIEPTSQTKGTLSGLYADGDELTINLSSGKNLGGSGKYIGVKATENFQEGDVLHLNMSTYQNGQNATAYVYADKDASVFLFDTEEKCDENKDYYITMPAAVNGHKELYIVRTAGNKWNGGPSIMEVTRAMKPMLTAITINGRDGVIDEANKTVAVQIPFEADLAALAVVPTIVRNAPHATTPEAVISNEGAWIEGDNTYRVMDKDGDYTDYTITLTRDVLKHAVKFYDGETLLETLEVEDGTSIAAGDVPADPTKEDYIFQYWSETEDGAEVDVTTVQINADKEFHAVWAPEGAIKLLDGSTVNHTNFITGVTANETVEFMGNTVNYAKFAGIVSSVSGVKDLTRVIAYNATTNKTKIRIYAHNNSTSGRNILVKGLVEGASEAVDLATIALGNKEDKVSDWIEFNNAANRTIYIMVSSSASDVYFTQVKVIESGETEMKQVGEAGYSLNFNKGRFFGVKDVTAHFEGMDVEVKSSDCQPLNTSVVKLASSSISFDVTAPVTLTVTTNNSNTYYVTKGAAGKDNETAKTGVSEFDLTTGEWYITAGSSNVEITNIAFELPKCEKPTITTQPATNHAFDPGNMTATVVATVSEGTLSYQWYNAANDEAVADATEATLTTTTEGTYYVVVTNSLAGHQDVFVTSDEAELGYRVINDATLSALSASVGTLDPEFDKNEENYSVNLAMGTTVVPTLSATATMNGYANVAINNAAEFENYEAISTVVVTSEDGTATKTYTVHFYVDYLLPQVDVTATTTWNWVNAGENMKVTDSTSPVKKNQEAVMANIRVDDKKPTNDATFRSQALLFYGENVRATDGGRNYASVGHISFNTTVPGIVEVEFSDNGTNNRRLKINDYISESSSSKTDVKTFKVYVQAGEVTLMGVKNDGTSANQYIRISKITFTANPTPDYERTVSNNIGTLCVEHNVPAGQYLGATFYQIASRNELYNDKIDFEEVLPNEELKAGEPYIFQSTTGKIELFFGETEAAEPVEVRGMIGNFAAGHLDITDDNKLDILYIAKNKLWNCEDLVESGLILNDHRAYIKMSDVPTYEVYEASKNQQNAAPRRRVTIGGDAPAVTTGIENGGLINGENGVQKVLINGQIFILRGEKMFDATGRLVK